MGFEELDKTLDCICHDYDYGIVPNSVTVFVRDKVENVGRFELTLLEGILLIIDAFEDGFRVMQNPWVVNVRWRLTDTFTLGLFVYTINRNS